MKKGYFFSIFVITALSLIILSYKSEVEFTEQKHAEIFQSRIEQTNIFVEDIEIDVERALFVSSFRAFLALDEFINSNKTYVEDVEDRLVELIVAGTYEGAQMNATNSSTLAAWLYKMENLSHSYRVNLTFKHLAFDVGLDSPFVVRITFQTNVSIQDLEDRIGWNFTMQKSVFLDISDAQFRDPIYVMESLENYEHNTGRNDTKPLTNAVRRSPYALEELWLNLSVGPVINIDVTNFSDHVQEQYYVHTNDSPSFFMRLQGITDCNDPLYSQECKKYGIMSYVNVINSSAVMAFSETGVQNCAEDYIFFLMIVMSR